MDNKIKDISGQRFGKLVVIRKAPTHKTKGGGRITMWLCKCDCGNETVVSSQKLRKAHTTSCGCAKRENKGRKFDDLTGKRFGRLTVIRFIPYREKTARGYNWLCKCDCGNDVKASASKLRMGLQKSCGCLKREKDALIGERSRKYEHSNKRLYSQYKAMLSRVNNKRSVSYKSYGGRGIKVCKEWQGEFGYERFAEWALSNGYDVNAKHGECTLDRKDVDGDYEPSNCRWVSNEAQQNNRRNNIRLEYNGKVHTIAEWSRLLSISYDYVYRHCRINGESIDEMLAFIKSRK